MSNFQHPALIFLHKEKVPGINPNYPMFFIKVVGFFQTLIFHKNKVIWSSCYRTTKWGLLWLFFNVFILKGLCILFKNTLFYLGPYHSELTASRPICAVKHCRAESVVRWGTTREYSGAPGYYLLILFSFSLFKDLTLNNFLITFVV